jgi:hypothetical protein
MATAVAEPRLNLVAPLATDQVPPVPVAPGTTETWDRLTDDLLRFRRLENDWDGQGADAPAPANVDAALAWLRQSRQWPRAVPPSRIVPGVAGEVIVEWQTGGLVLVAELNQPTQVEWVLVTPGRPNRHWTTSTDLPWLVALER